MTDAEKKAKELKELEEKKKLEESTKQLQLKKIEEMKKKMETMVDPVEYQKLKDEYSTLLDEYVNKREPIVPIEKKLRPAQEIAKELANIKDGNISNRAYIEKTLEYRTSHIKEFGTDPFADFGATGSGQENADTKQVVQVLETLLKENPSPVDFRIKLNSVLKDDPQLMSKLKRRKK